MYNLPTRFKILRESKSLTQEQLAHELDIWTRTIGRWERGEQIPDAKNIMLICEFFGCSADFLLGLKDE